MLYIPQSASDTPIRAPKPVVSQFDSSCLKPEKN